MTSQKYDVINKKIVNGLRLPFLAHHRTATLLDHHGAEGRSKTILLRHVGTASLFSSRLLIILTTGYNVCL
jgi:hypothetical protein